VTMDVVMPNLSGIQAVAAITAEFPDARIVMCSAMGQERLIDEAMTAGASAFVVKPFDGAKLLHAVEDAIAPVGELS
jgi:two-component system chemotaxis response regulator CheY